MFPNSDQVKSIIFAQPEIEAWPELREICERSLENPRPDWQLPYLACQAAGGEPESAIPLIAALLCFQRSIIMVDDILDQDPRGIHHKYGTASSANLALALQAAAIRIINMVATSPDNRSELMDSFAHMALKTAYGQQLDVQNFTDESGYWVVVRAKSVPFYAQAVYAGAVLANAPPETAGYLQQIGGLLGEIVQLYDDLQDAMQVPANPDWQQGRNNLLILYALTAPHTEHQLLRDLLPHVSDSQTLQQVQRILITSGAVSYCVYHVVQRYREARHLMDALSSIDSAPLRDLLDRHVEPVLTLFQITHTKVPIELDLD